MPKITDPALLSQLNGGAPRVLVPAGPPKPGTGYQPAPGGGQTYIPGSGEDPVTIRRQTEAREGVATDIQVAGQIRAANARAGIDLEVERQKRELGKGDKGFEQATTLRTELERQPSVKSYKNALASYSSAMQSQDNPAGDLNIIYAFAKIMDPESVVREGEANSVAAVGSIGERIAGELRKQLDGQGRLAPELRRNLMREMGTRVGDYNKGYTAERARFRGLAERQGVDPQNVVGPHLGDAFAKIENKFWRGDENKGPRDTDDQAAAILGKLGIEAAPSGQQSGGPQVAGGPPSAPSPAPPSPEEFEAKLKSMLDAGAPASDILNYVRASGSTLNQRDQGVLRDYDKARLGGQDTQVGVRVQPAESTAGGIVEGGMNVFDRAAMGAQWLGNLLPGVDSTSATEAAASRPAALDAIFGKRSSGGRMLGGGLATAPLALVPGGPALQGALAGSLTGDSDTLGGVAMDAGKGAIAGKLGDMALKGGAFLLSPELRQSVRDLASRGVRLTPGRMFGGKFQSLEDRAASLPVTGPRIAESWDNSLADYNIGGANQPLADIGEMVPAGTPAGHETVKFVKDRFSKGYEDVLPKLDIKLDPTFATRLNAIKAMARRDGLPDAQMQELETIISRDVGGAFTPGRGQVRGKSWKRLDERLDDLGTTYKGSDNPYERQLGGFVQELKDQSAALVRRSNPMLATRLRDLDRGYAKYTRIRDAASKSVDDGIYTPGELRTAVRSGDRSVGKGATATGDALMQDWAKAGSDVLPSRIGNSGTADRENLTDWKAWAAGTALAPIYGQNFQRFLQGALTAPRHPAAEPIAELLKRLPASTLTPALIAPRD